MYLLLSFPSPLKNRLKFSLNVFEDLVSYLGSLKELIYILYLICRFEGFSFLILKKVNLLQMLFITGLLMVIDTKRAPTIKFRVPLMTLECRRFSVDSLKIIRRFCARHYDCIQPSQDGHP